MTDHGPRNQEKNDHGSSWTSNTIRKWDTAIFFFYLRPFPDLSHMRSNAVSFMENDNWGFKRRGKWRVSEELESAEFCDDITRVKFNFFSLQFKLIIILWGLMYYISSFTPIFPSNCGHISSSVLKCSSRVSLRIDQRFMT